MKRFFAVALFIVLVVNLVGCSNESLQEKYDAVVAERDALQKQVLELTKQIENDLADSTIQDTSSEESEKSTLDGNFDETTILEQLEVKEYHYSTDFFNFAFLVIQNNSPYNLSISANANFYDESGNMIGAKNSSQDAIESGYNTILYFMPDEKYASMDYNLDVREEDFYGCVQSDLSYEVSKATDKIILSVTNNGTEPAEFVEGYVLFFSGENPVEFSSSYFTDDDMELKPNKTINKEMDCYEDYDSYQVFFSGNR